MMKISPNYLPFFLRLAALMTLIIVMAAFLSLLIGAESPGSTISAFTTDHFETTNVWLMDVSRNKYVHLQVTGHADDIPVWSTQQRRLIYFPRSP